MKQLKNSIGLLANVAVGGAINSSIASSGMSPGFKDATQSMVGVGLMSHAYKNISKKKGGLF